MSGHIGRLKTLVFLGLCQAIVQGLRSDHELGDAMNTHSDNELTDSMALDLVIDANEETGNCKVGASNIFGKGYSASSAAGMAVTFCDEGGDADCLVRQYDVNYRTKGIKDSIRLASETCKHGRDSCMIDAVFIFKKGYAATSWGHSAPDMAADFCKSGGDVSCLKEQYAKHYKIRDTMDSITMAAETCKQQGLIRCNAGAVWIFRKAHSASSAAAMAKTFCEEGGNGDCMGQQYDHHFRASSATEAVKVASEVCKNGKRDSCRGDAVNIFKKSYQGADITKKADIFCQEGGDGECLEREYPRFNHLLTKQQVKSAVCVCKTGQNTDARHDAVHTFMKYYKMSNSMFGTDACAMVEDFFHKKGNARCFAEQYGQHYRTKDAKASITLALAVCTE